MGLIATLRARMRLLLTEQVQRRMPRRSAKPPIGAHIVHLEQGLRLTVQAGTSDELWHWLMDQGWRVERHRPDRRAYRDIPASYVNQLIDADPAQRERLMAEAIANAQQVRKQQRS
jgi:hypothetical protein